MYSLISLCYAWPGYVKLLIHIINISLVASPFHCIGLTRRPKRKLRPRFFDYMDIYIRHLGLRICYFPVECSHWHRCVINLILYIPLQPHTCTPSQTSMLMNLNGRHNARPSLPDTILQTLVLPSLFSYFPYSYSHHYWDSYEPLGSSIIWLTF